MRGGNALEQQLTFRPDLDSIDALAPEREALWARLEKTSFLTTDEKRALIGYDPAPTPITTKFNPNHDELGRFTSGDDTDGDGDGPQPAAFRPRPPPKAPPTPAKPAPAATPTPPKKTEDILKPDGKELGAQNPGARAGIRTVEKSEYEQLQKQLLDGAKEVAAPKGHACLLSSGLIAKYVSMTKEIGHDRPDTGRSVA